MTLNRSSDGTKLNVKFSGEIDSTNAAEIENTLLQETAGITDLTFDLEELEYISSAGLRVLLMMQKTMKKQGSMMIINTNEEVMDIFKVTGFVRLLNIA